MLIYRLDSISSQFYVAVWPVGFKEMTAGEITMGFFRESPSSSPPFEIAKRSADPLVSILATLLPEAWLALPIVIIFYVIGLVWKRSRPFRAHEIDIDVSFNTS